MIFIYSLILLFKISIQKYVTFEIKVKFNISLLDDLIEDKLWTHSEPFLVNWDIGTKLT